MIEQDLSQQHQNTPEAPKPKRTRKKSGNPSKEQTPTQALPNTFWNRRNDEIIGLALLTSSTLLLVALFFYSEKDALIIENIGLFELFSKYAHAAASRLENPMGIIGAKLSAFLINTLFGYPTFFLLVALGIWGWILFRKKDKERALIAFIYAAVFTLLFSTLFGLTSLSVSLCGNIGRSVASLLEAIIGSVGAWAIVLIGLVVTSVLAIDLDLQKTTDRLIFMFQRKAVGAKIRFKEWYAEREALRELENRDPILSSTDPETESSLHHLEREGDVEVDSTAPEPDDLVTHLHHNSATQDVSKNPERSTNSGVEAPIPPTEIPTQTPEFEPKDAVKHIEVHLADTPSEEAPFETLEVLSRPKPPASTLPEDFGYRFLLKEEEKKFQEKLQAVRREAEKLQSPPTESQGAAAQDATAPPTDNPQDNGNSESNTPEPSNDVPLVIHSPLKSVLPPSESVFLEVSRTLSEPLASNDASERDRSSISLPLSAKAEPNPISTNPTKSPLSSAIETEGKKAPNNAVPIIPLRPRKFDEDTVEPTPDDSLLDELIFGKKDPSDMPPPDDVEITIRQGVREQEADLDERDLDVETRERVPYQFPSVDLLIDGDEQNVTVTREELENNKRRLLEKLKIYKIDVVRVEATVGPRVTLFELELAPDVKISRIVTLADDIAMAMSARGIRIIAPIPGKNAVGVEIPNAKTQMVRIKSVLQSEKFKNSNATLPIVFGKTISNEIFVDDLAKMPHLLIAGTTGSGKSVGINNILTSLIYFCPPDKVKFLLIDPKRVELFPYQKLKNHFLVKYRDIDEQIITDTSKAVYALKSVEKEMDRRYERMQKGFVRHIKDFNAKFPNEALPYIVVVIDELADLMITAGKDVEEPIARLAQLARAVGIHLVVATQRPSVDVITGVIKANFPARIAYQVSSKIDSRTILDGPGADQLLGNGDMLYQPASEPKPIRIQNAYVSTEEVERITEFIYEQEGVEMYMLPAPDLKLGSAQEDDDDLFGGKSSGERDKMFEEAARLVVRHQMGSVSLLQRRLKLGFGRAARIVDQLEEAGIVGSPDGTKARQVLIQDEASLELLLNNLE